MVFRGYQGVSFSSYYTVQLCLNPKSVLEFHKSKCDDMTVKVIFSSSAAPAPQWSWRRERRRRRSKKNWESASRHREINQSAAFVIECVCVFYEKWKMIFLFSSRDEQLMKVAFHLFDGKYVNSIIFHVKRKIEEIHLSSQWIIDAYRMMVWCVPQRTRRVPKVNKVI